MANEEISSYVLHKTYKIKCILFLGTLSLNKNYLKISHNLEMWSRMGLKSLKVFQSFCLIISCKGLPPLSRILLEPNRVLKKGMK